MSRTVTDFLQLDQNQDKIRQRTLAGSDLAFDPNIPIYQHPLNIKNIIEGSDEAFGEIMRIFALGHPDEQMRKQAQQYVEKQEEIDNLNDGQMNELQDKNLNEQVGKLKEQINSKKNELMELQNKILGTDQSNEMIKGQIQSYQKYIKQPKNNQVLSKLSNLKDSFQTQNLSFKTITQKLQQKAKYLLSKFDSEYNSIAYEKKQLVSIEEQLAQLRTANDGKKVEIGTINRMSLKLEDEVDAIEDNLNAESQNLRVSFEVLNEVFEDENQNLAHSSLSQDSPQQLKVQYAKEQQLLGSSSQSKTFELDKEQRPLEVSSQNQKSSQSSSSNKSQKQKISAFQIEGDDCKEFQQKSDVKSTSSKRSSNFENKYQHNGSISNKIVKSQLKQYNHVQKKHDYSWMGNTLFVFTLLLFVLTLYKLF